MRTQVRNLFDNCCRLLKYYIIAFLICHLKELKTKQQQVKTNISLFQLVASCLGRFSMLIYLWHFAHFKGELKCSTSDDLG